MLNRPSLVHPRIRTLLPWLIRACALAMLLWYLVLLYLPAGTALRVYALTIPKGASFNGIAAELEQVGMIRSSLHFRLVARLRGLDRSMQAGDYRLSAAMLPAEILEKLASGLTDSRKFALPEGYSIYQTAELLERQGIFGRQEFLDACADPQLLKKLHIPTRSVEGFLFPGTYQVGFKMSEVDLIKEMVREFRHRTERLQPLVAASGKSLVQVVTLASMVEREAMVAEEKPLIASVFLNRLKVGMPLQSDPTAVYGVKVFGGGVTREDLQRKSPYNTYQIKGIPPGPIGNPGFDALVAVLEPAKTDYFYFVARKDGTHQFSRTLAEHNQGVNRFLRRGKKR